MRSTIEQAPEIDPHRLHPDDLRAVLAAVLAIHGVEDPTRFPEVLLDECERLLPADHIDAGELRRAWAERGVKGLDPVAVLRPSWPGGPHVAADGHRLELVASGSRHAFRIVLERYAQPFEAPALALAGVLQPHLGPAFDHARLRAAEREVTEAMRTLTVREQEVLALVADGRTNRDIGLALFIEPRTVEKHVEHIRAKLGARSRADAAAKWARGVAMPFG